MTYLWVNIEILNANFDNLSLDDKKSIIFNLDSICKNLNCDKILFSVNTTASISYAKIFLRELEYICQLCGIEFEIGPHFVDEGCFYKEKISGFIELFFRNRIDKLAWFLDRYQYTIKSLLFIDTKIDYEPIVISKIFAQNIPLLFAHGTPDLGEFYNERMQENFYEVTEGQFLLSASVGVKNKLERKQKLELKK